MSEKGEQLFKEVFLQFYPLLLQFGLKLVPDEYLVEEAIQELFLYIYEKEVDLAGINNLKAYLITAFRRRVLLKKKEARFTDLSEIKTDIAFSADELWPSGEEQREQLDQLASLLNALPWRQKEALYLKYFNNLSAKEVAEIMGIQPQVVSNMVYKALRKIRSQLPAIFLLIGLLIASTG